MSLKISYVTKHILTNCYWDLIPKSVKYLFYIFMYYSVFIHSSVYQQYILAAKSSTVTNVDLWSYL